MTKIYVIKVIKVFFINYVANIKVIIKGFILSPKLKLVVKKCLRLV